MIKEFKLWCVENDKAVPECDAEILRAMYGNKMSPKGSYDWLMDKYGF